MLSVSILGRVLLRASSTLPATVRNLQLCWRDYQAFCSSDELARVARLCILDFALTFWSGRVSHPYTHR